MRSHLLTVAFALFAFALLAFTQDAAVDQTVDSRAWKEVRRLEISPNLTLKSTSLSLGAIVITRLDQVVVRSVEDLRFGISQAREALDAAFPAIGRGGSFPADSLDCSPAFAAFMAELRGPELTAAVAAKFGINLAERPVMVTLRGQSRAKDGRIHTDSTAKLITVLIYMNPTWDSAEGRLRLLRGPDDIEDYGAEVPPERGTLLAFRCGPTAYHGHKPYVGQRRSVQVNWMTDRAVLRRELGRHGLSAWTKRLFGFGAGPDAGTG
ncbi:MAG: 2OG-Fe(II) oxygenase [Proteobacteria bacterium]|nr:2OG-Fe(II) oxygenase [Pseudomonadota bacterium]